MRDVIEWLSLSYYIMKVWRAFETRESILVDSFLCKENCSENRLLLLSISSANADKLHHRSIYILCEVNLLSLIYAIPSNTLDYYTASALVALSCVTLAQRASIPSLLNPGRKLPSKMLDARRIDNRKLIPWRTRYFIVQSLSGFD